MSVPGFKASGPAKVTLLFLFILSVFSFGCAGFQLQTAALEFDDPVQKLGIHAAEPTSDELAGVLLRERPEMNQPFHYQIENTLFAQIKNQSGKRMKFSMHQTNHAQIGSRPNTYRLISETIFEGEGGKLFEDKELTDRGEITKLIQGEHQSRLGTFTISSWKREPVYPEGKIKIGETWKYQETMDVRMKSKWIKQIHPEPYQVESASELTGFAQVGSRRCAVIVTRSKQIQRQHFKVLWKEVDVNIRSEIENTAYLDLARKKLAAQITKTKSWTEGLNLPFQDTGEGQTILYTLE